MATLSTECKDVCTIITERIIERLEQGTVPWQRPWQGGGPPLNFVSRKPYRGINVWMLASAGYVSPYWISFRQAQQLGGYVRKGEKSLPVVFWKVDEKPDPENPDATKKRFVLRYYNVFNSEQCDLPDSVKSKLALPEPKEIDPIDVCEQVVTAMPNPPMIEHREPRAYYSPAIDRVNMPTRGLFDGAEEYYSTLFHELGHSTGHASRLARDTITDICPFGSTNYSKEELIAEMTAAFLCGVCGIENRTIDNSAAYVAGWLRQLRDDRRLVVFAAAQAQRAAEHIMAAKPRPGAYRERARGGLMDTASTRKSASLAPITMGRARQISLPPQAGAITPWPGERLIAPDRIAQKVHFGQSDRAKISRD